MDRAKSKYFKTAVKMDKAFLHLLEKKEFAYITVKEICETAGVNRSTFYLHYETLADLLAESVDYINQSFLSHMQHDAPAFVEKLRHCPREDLYLVTPEYLMPYLSYIQEHQRLFCTALENAATLRLKDSYTELFRHVFLPILERCGVPERDRTYVLMFYLRGLMAIVTEWLKGDCADPIEHIVAVMQRCVKTI